MNSKCALFFASIYIHYAFLQSTVESYSVYNNGILFDREHNFRDGINEKVISANYTTCTN